MPSGCHLDAIDAPRSRYLAERALERAQTLLKPEGSALINLLQGADFRHLSHQRDVSSGAKSQS
jgi:23S rRNA U2552 (ribose-2'-O)-methylase RlmE/FtsJ